MLDALYDASDLAFAFGSLGMAALVLLGGRRWTNVLLALFFLAWGLTPGFLLLVTPDALEPADYTRTLTGVTNALGLAILPIYLAFLGCALQTPLVRPFRAPLVRALLLAVAALAFLAALSRFPSFADVSTAAAAGTPWAARPAGVRTMIVFLVASGVVGLVAALDALRRAPPGSVTRARMRSYAASFILFDVGQAAYFLAVASIPDGAGRTLVLSGSNFASVAGLVLLARALLREQLFDFDLRVKRGIERSTVAGSILVAFLVVAQLVEGYTSTTFGLVGGSLAAGLVLFALRPLERLAARVADAAMPAVRDTPEYRLVRKRELYRAAVEGALQDGEVTQKERTMLARIADELGLTVSEALEIEREAAGVMRA